MKTLKIVANRFLKIGMLSLAMLFTISSCDYLDQKPENLKTVDKIWENRADVEAYLYNIYGYIWLSVDDPITMGFADETSCVISGVAVREMVKGNWGPSNAHGDRWSSAYRPIHKALTFEANIDKVPDAVVSAELREQYKAESRFLRGWFYWNLLRMYGPFVVFEKPGERNEDYSSYTRRPFDFCVEYVCKLMESTLNVLPDVWPSNSNLGRPTKGAALAVIAQARLLAASELWNGNPEFKDFKNKDGELLAPQTKDEEKWRIAAEAAQDVIDLGIYHLYKNTESGDSQFDPYLSCREVFMNSTNAEIIFGTFRANDWQWGHDKRCNPKPGGYCMANATQNIVDAFLTKDGYDINDDENYTTVGFAHNDDPRNFGSTRSEYVNRGYRAGESNMYVDREPRFYVNIHYNGRPALSAVSKDDYDYFSSDKNKDGYGRAEYYYSGTSGASTQIADFTGYNIAKRVSTTSSIRSDQTVYRPYIHIRYAEILLNYMEAMNEYDPTDAKIITYFNEIRSRAGVESITATYPAVVGDREKMREWILRERQIELAFEGDRYWTCQRRLLFEKEENRKIYRMNVMADDGGQGFMFEDFYKPQLLETRYWDNKMYLYPIPQYEMDRAQGLVQNPGW